jgi:uncharacterized protein DUF4375
MSVARKNCRGDSRPRPDDAWPPVNPVRLGSPNAKRSFFMQRSWNVDEGHEIIDSSRMRFPSPAARASPSAYQEIVVDWYALTGDYHKRTFGHGCRLSSLPAEWQRELAALWRLEADVNNGAYLQFLANWGRDSYVYASQALRKIGARKMAEIIDPCQALVDEHFESEGKSSEDIRQLLANAVMDCRGKSIKPPGSLLPEPVAARIYDLSLRVHELPRGCGRAWVAPLPLCY